MNQQPSTSSCPARGRLERMALDVLAALCRDSDCCVEFRDRTAVQYCTETLAYVPKPEAPPRRRRLDARLAVLRPFARLLAVAGTAHALITQRRTMSLREVYYVRVPRARGPPNQFSPRRPFPLLASRPTPCCSTLSRTATTPCWTWLP